MGILVVNAGSSSLKVGLVDAGRAVASYEGLSAEPPAVDAVGHRIVHGGPDFTKPALVDAGIERRLRHLPSCPPTPGQVAADAHGAGCGCGCTLEGLQVLLRSRDDAAAADARLGLAGVQPVVRRLLERTGTTGGCRCIPARTW
jgi:hypothetical protein